MPGLNMRSVLMLVLTLIAFPALTTGQAPQSDVQALKQRVAELRAKQGNQSVELAKALKMTARAHVQQQAYDEAVALLKESVAIYDQQPKSIFPDHGEAILDLGICYVYQEHPQDAIPYLQKAEQIFSKAKAKSRGYLTGVYSGLATCYLQGDDAKQFQKYAQLTLTLIDQSDPPVATEIGLRKELAASYVKTGLPDEKVAEVLFEALARCAQFPEPTVSRAEILTSLAEVHRRQKREDHAVVCEELAKAIQDFVKQNDNAATEKLEAAEEKAVLHWLKDVSTSVQSKETADSIALQHLVRSNAAAGRALLAANLDENSQVARVAFITLGTMGDRAVPACVRGLIDTNPFIRFTARRILDKRGLEVCPPLNAAIAGDDPQLRAAALLQLQGLAETTVPKIIEAMKTNPDVEIQTAGARLLKPFGRFAKDARDLLSSLQTNPQVDLAAAAKDSLATIDEDIKRASEPAPQLPDLDEAFRKRAPELRKRTAQAFRSAAAELVADNTFTLAAEAAETARKILEDLLGRNHPSTLAALGDKAGALAMGGELEQAERGVLELLEAIEENPESAGVDEDLANPFTALGMVYMRTGRGSAAEPMLLRALAIRESNAKPQANDLAVALGNLAAFYREADLPEKAMVYADRAIAVAEAHPQEIMDVLLLTLFNHKGLLLSEQEQHAEGLAVLQRGEKICQDSTDLSNGHPQYGIVLDNIGLVLHRSGKMTEARPYFEHALKIFRSHPQSNDTAICLLNLADLEKDEQRYSKAITYYREAISIREKVLNKSHPLVFNALTKLATTYELAGKTTEAEKIRKRVNDGIAERTTQNESRKKELLGLVSQAAENLTAGNYIVATTQLDQAVVFIEQDLGLDPEVFRIYLLLADGFERLEKFDRARAILERARKLLELTPDAQQPLRKLEFHQALGELLTAMNRFQDAQVQVELAIKLSESIKDFPVTKHSALYNQLGVLAGHTSDFSTASKHFDTAVSMLRPVKGEYPDQYSAALANRAMLYKHEGDVKQAEALLNEAIKISTSTNGENHPHTLAIQGNLGVLYYELGNYERAIPIYARAIEVSSQTLGKEHLLTVTRMSDLGENLKLLGKYEEAAPWLIQAAEISLRVRPNDIETATVLMNLAQLKHAQNKHRESAVLYGKALEISSKRNDGRNQITPEVHWLLAHVYQDEADYQTARTHLEKSYELQTQVLGAASHRTGRCRCDLAEALFHTGERDLALEHWRGGWEVLNRYRRDAFCFSSSNEQLLLHEVFQSRLDQILPMAIEADDPRWRALAASAVLSSKGLTVEALARRHAVLANQDADVAPLLRELELAQTSLFQVSLNPPRNALDKPDMDIVNAMRDRVRQAEAKLAQVSSPLMELRNSSEATVNQVVERLPGEAVLVEYLKYSDKTGPHYAALVLRRGQNSKEPLISLVPLEKAEVIDRSINRWRTAVAPELARNGKEISETPELTAAGKQLAGLIWDPIAKEIGTAKTVFIASDGNVAFVPLGALPGPKEQSFLIESLAFVYLTTGRELISAPLDRSNGPALVVGEPQFGTRLNAQAKSNANSSKSTLPALAQLKFESYAGTQQEADTIEKLLREKQLSPQRLKAEQATETALRTVMRPRMIHFATHGFFLSTDETVSGSTAKGLRGVGSMRPKASAPATTLPTTAVHQIPMLLTDPMQRSGIALAGINDTVDGKRPTGGDDGILTAQEISTLKLQGTELVVVSTCDSGLGEALDGEGVFGMRRAFAMAGAKVLVISLWPVADRPTNELMVAMYRNYCDGAASHVALRAAQLKMIANKRAAGKFPHPFYWAAFVSSGRDERK